MPQNTTTAEFTPHPLPSWLWYALAAAVVFVYLYGLNIPLLGPDEPRYAQVAREMFDRGDWITPTLGGHTWFEKPALLYWLEMISYTIFGVNEFAARFGSAVFGLGTVAAMWFLGRSLGKKSEVANWFALITATTLGILVFARGASFDIIVTFPMTASLVSFFVYYRREADGEQGRLLPLGLFYFFIGVSLLAKGLIGILFPFAIVGAFYVASWRFPARAFWLSVVWGSVLAAAVAAVWYVPVYLANGWPFVDEFIIQHHFQRFTSNKYQHPQPFYFFWWVLPLMTLPWLPAFVASLWRSARSAFKTKSEQDEKSRPLTLFCIVWMFVPLVFFSLSGSKLSGYILPSVPPAIALAAIYISRLTVRSKPWRNAILAVACGMLLLIPLLLHFAVPKFAESDSVRSLITSADNNGYSGAPVLGLHTLSHNAEFYAAGRLVRDQNGSQRRFSNTQEIVSWMDANAVRQAVVLVPKEHARQLAADQSLGSTVLSDNGELAVAVVNRK
jgi:4-amino-4-deoxy-L-arabinose transferase-like glycosyltransferase